MSDFENEMNKVVQGFVAQITDLARRAAINTLESALGKTNGARRGGGASVRAGRGRGVKRTADDLDKLQERFHGFVKENPGLRIEQINKQLGTSTKDLALPIRKLIAEGSVKTKGEKRSTQYFAGEGGRKKKSKG